MKILLKTTFLTLFLSCTTIITAPVASAASLDECAIWLCLPSGFPDGCGAAYGAFKNRIKHGKSPLPSFSSCSVDSGEVNNSQLTYTQKAVIHIAEHQVCVRRSDRGGRCLSYKTVPEHVRKGRTCFKRMASDSVLRIKGCTGAYYQFKIYQDGEKIGETFYWSPYSGIPKFDKDVPDATEVNSDRIRSLKFN